MLHKCVNPNCSTVFRSLGCGKLFQIESQVSLPSAEFSGTRRSRPRRVARYWLCEKCSASLTLTFHRSLGVATIPLPPLEKRVFPAAHA
jgi:hypothetical protein